MLKNKLFAGAIFALALFVAGTVSAAYTFPNKIDTLQEKKDVQTVLNMNGANLTVDGVFGPKSIAAVKTFQGSKGLEADGIIGPMTRAALEAASVAGGTVSTIPGCTAGALFSATTGAACTTVVSTIPGCTAGALFSATTGASCTTGVVTTPGATGTLTGTTDGSLNASASSYISSGITLKKGETKDVAAVHLQASVGPVKVSRLDVTFDVRPWLYFSTVTLHDNNGAVLATKSISSIADTTELVVGSKYQVRFDNLSYIVTPGTNPDLAVSATVLSSTDKIIGSVPVSVGIPSLRTINAIGYSETVSFGTLNSITLTSTGSAAVIYSRISPISPVAGQQVVSLTQTTNDVVLGAFSIKSSNQTSTLNTLKVSLSSGTIGDFSNFRLFVGGTSVAGGIVDATAVPAPTITFSNMTTPLALDAWTDLVIKADIKANPAGTTAALSLISDGANAGVGVTDVNYGAVTYGTTGIRVTNTLTLTANSVAVTSASAVLGSAIVQANVTTGYNATYKLTLTNSSNNDLFVSATPANFLAMTAGTSTLSSITASPSIVNGDVPTVAFAIPAGTAREFTLAGAVRGAAGSTVTFAASAVKYSTTATAPTNDLSITNGLSALSLTASF